jgi:hypothetical protein
MNLCDYTLIEFMCGLPSGGGHAANPWEAFKEGMEEGGWKLGTEMPVDGKSDFAIAEADADDGDVILLIRVNGSWEPIGCYIGEVVTIDEQYLGNGLSTPLILRAVEKRQLPSQRKLSEPGYNALRRAWMSAVEKCIDGGASLRPEVVASFEEEKSKGRGERATF